MKLLESKNFPRNRIIDGRVFKIADLDFLRLLEEGIAYGSLSERSPKVHILSDMSFCNYPRVLSHNDITVKLGIKSYVSSVQIKGSGEVSFGKFCAIANGIYFQMLKTVGHNCRNVSSYGLGALDWPVIPKKIISYHRH